MARAAAWIPAFAAALMVAGCSNEQPDEPRARAEPQPAETAGPAASGAEALSR